MGTHGHLYDILARLHPVQLHKRKMGLSLPLCRFEGTACGKLQQFPLPSSHGASAVTRFINTKSSN